MVHGADPRSLLLLSRGALLNRLLSYLGKKRGSGETARV
jgi:hypothetical protein